MEVEMSNDTDLDGAATPAPAPATPSATGGGVNKHTEPRRRNRPALSCIQCRTRKIRCDRNEPCASCLKSKIVNCTYEEARRPKPRLWRLSPAPTSAAASHPSDSSPIAEDQQRLGVGPGYTFREVSLTPAPGGSSAGAPNPPYATGPATASTSSGEPTAAPSPAPPRVSIVDHGPGSSAQPVHANGFSNAHTHNANSTAALAERVQQLEQQLADALKRPDHGPHNPHLSLPTPASSQGACSSPGAGRLVDGDKLVGQLPHLHFLDRFSLSGLAGPASCSHSCIFPLIISIAKRIASDRTSEIYHLLKECKDLCRVLKAQNIPTYVRPQVGIDMPGEPVARRLVEAYFRTFEGVYRILHQPTFWKEYRMYWENPRAASPEFVVQLQLCMAIGTCFQDDVTSLRRSAVTWIYEARAWLVAPCDKARVDLGLIQTLCLLHLARETCGVSSDLTWIGAGSLLRTAMYMGLHRDPDNLGLSGMSVFRVEMRRRLWATVLEISLQSSMDSGGPPLIMLSDFDTRPPSNYDDNQFSEDENHTPTPRSPGAFTQTTVQLALLRSFPTRLGIAQYINHFKSSNSYEETLRWNTDLTAACRALSATIQQSYDPAGILPRRLSLFQLRMAEHMVHRFFLALNHPWLGSAQNNPAYYFSRKMCVETSLKLYRAFATGSPAGDCGTASPSDDFTRLSTCGYGAFRSVPTLAVLTICLELLWQVQEDRSYRLSMNIDSSHERSGSVSDPDVGGSVGISIGSGAAPRQDLLEAVRYAIGWCKRRIKMGETNIKGYLIYSALLSQVQAIQRGASDADAEHHVIGTIVEVLDECRHLLREVAGGSLSLSAIAGALNGGHAGCEDEKTSWREDWKPEDSFCHVGLSSIFNFHDADFFIGT
ncbi:fungal-specific transcription factor domain-containing protein [Podospora fimiseda]|uniref:Fungal-specific transcription factor domain-containing protein n=1 Tax=Podospora fimiseda TaxID=252190 RepID=A0AAN7BNU9_9PEZI|nr:fungal-specific transcription factor domain-containing protein [Podospora fimiseda]